MTTFGSVLRLAVRPHREWGMRPHELSLRLQLGPSGVLLGVDAARRPVARPLLRPERSTQVGVLGSLGHAQLLALRLLDRSCHLTVVSDRPGAWRSLAAERPMTVCSQVRHWPSEATPAPWALIIDMPEAPPPGFVATPWTTVAHLARSPELDTPWWRSADLLLADRGLEGQVAALRPEVRPVGMPGAGELLVVDPGSWVAVDPQLSDGEYRLLEPR